MLTFNTRELKNPSLDIPELKQLSDSSLKVGFFENARYPSGEFVAQVAKWNEVGTIHTPPRPFLRSTIAKNKDKWDKKIPLAYKQSNMQSKLALGILGEIIRADIVKEITALSTPPNAQSTIKAKGSSNPLIDTGLMRRSVTYKVGK